MTIHVPAELAGSRFDKEVRTLQGRPKISDAMAGYLRVCRCGGMPTTQSDQVMAAVEDAERLGYFEPPQTPPAYE